jgi:soluble lytic murein transglycosylase-like protein
VIGYVPLRTKATLVPYVLLLAVAWVAFGDAGLLNASATKAKARPRYSAASAAKAVAYAKRQVGKPYAWGAEGPGAFDCSGLTYAAWRSAGVAIPRTAADQLVYLPRVRGALKPGDLLVYASNGPSRRHVAMALGRNRMIEALGSGIPVRVIRVRHDYLGAVRPGGALAPSRTARADIPRHYLRLYQQAGASSGIPWQVLAGVGKAESNHGRVAGAKPGGSSSAGALGPMQFMPGTWATWGRGGNVYDPADAIPAAARYLHAIGAPGDLRRAVAGYNAGPGRADNPPAETRRYVEDVLAWNHRYQRGA